MKQFNILILLVISGLMLQSCNSNCIKGSGNVINQSRQVASFSAIDVGGAYKIELTQDSVESLQLEGDDNLLEHVKTEVSGSTLKISSKNNFCSNKRITIRAHLKDLTSIDASGANDVTTTNKFKLNNFKFTSSGATESSMELEASRIETSISGAGKLMLTGQTGDLDIKISGAGKVRAFDMAAGKCWVDVSGAGDTEVNVLNQLDVSASGASKVVYKGRPAKVSESATGASTVKAADM